MAIKAKQIKEVITKSRKYFILKRYLDKHGIGPVLYGRNGQLREIDDVLMTLYIALDNEHIPLQGDDIEQLEIKLGDCPKNFLFAVERNVGKDFYLSFGKEIWYDRKIKVIVPEEGILTDDVILLKSRSRLRLLHKRYSWR